ncbi:MAG: NADPH-dependent FMN reductase [Flavobacteriales bacterium]
MKKIMALSGSKNTQSVNYKLVNLLINDFENVWLKDLRTLEIPVYSQDLEREHGIPNAITDLINEMKVYDAFIVNTNEHNGYLSAFFKNIIDWMSRADSNFMGNKPVFLISSSPGAKGGASALESLSKLMGYFGGEVEAKIALPNVYDHLSKDLSSIVATLEMNALSKRILTFVNS